MQTLLDPLVDQYKYMLAHRHQRHVSNQYVYPIDYILIRLTFEKSDENYCTCHSDICIDRERCMVLRYVLFIPTHSMLLQRMHYSNVILARVYASVRIMNCLGW